MLCLMFEWLRAREYSVQLTTRLRHWEHQREWWTSEQLLWPGGPEVQQQPHPPWKQKTISQEDFECAWKTALSPFIQMNYRAFDWPLSAGTRVTPACEGAPSYQSQAAFLWSFQPGWDACSGSGGTDAHLKSTTAKNKLTFESHLEDKMSCFKLQTSKYFVPCNKSDSGYQPSICFCSWGGAAASMDAVRGSCPWTWTAGWTERGKKLRESLEEPQKVTTFILEDLWLCLVFLWWCFHQHSILLS